MLREFVSMFNKVTGKRPFLAFPGKGCKKEKNASSITKIEYIQTTTEKSWLDQMSTMREKKLKPQKTDILKKSIFWRNIRVCTKYKR